MLFQYWSLFSFVKHGLNSFLLDTEVQEKDLGFMLFQSWPTYVLNMDWNGLARSTSPVSCCIYGQPVSDTATLPYV